MEHGNKVQIELEIAASAGCWTHDFDKNAKVSDLIQATLQHFDLAEGDYQVRKVSDGELLQHNRTLTSYHLVDGSLLTLVRKGEIRLTIETPVGDWTHDFDENGTIGQVIAATLQQSGLAEGDYEIRKVSDNGTLQPDHTLISYYLESGDVLMLIPQHGGGV
jgi:hypothetical protein